MNTADLANDELINKWLNLEKEYFEADYGLEVNLRALIRERIKELENYLEK